MKKFILILCLLSIGVVLGIVGYKYHMNAPDGDVDTEKEYSFDTAYGTLNLDADKALEARGTAGASNMIFYLKNNNLYLYSGESINELYAKNVDDIYYEKEQSEQITVVTNKDTVIVKKSSYLNYLIEDGAKEENELKEFHFDIAHGPITIEASKALQVKTEPGTTEYIYYLKNNNLYHFVIEGEDELCATNVRDILFVNDGDEVITVITDETSNILMESEYLLYISKSLNQFVFDTANGKIVIKANKALAARGTAGASSNIFYLVDDNLYLYSSKNINELYATNISDIYYEGEQTEQIIVITTDKTVIKKESTYLKYNNKSDDNEDKVDDLLEEFTFNTAYGVVTIRANYALAGRGSSGASNNIFYIKNNNLYSYVHGGVDELLAINIRSMYYETAQVEYITVITDENTIIKNESVYLKYVNVENKEFTFETAYGTVKIDATYALRCRGTAGSSNMIFYVKDKNLYYYVHNGDDELYIMNVDKIYYEEGQVEQITVVTNEDTIILKESTYLKYESAAKEMYTFETAYGTVKIDATHALSCRGISGAANMIFYIKNNYLYYYVHNGEDELYAKNVNKIYYASKQAENITVVTNQYTNILKEHSCLEYN